MVNWLYRTHVNAYSHHLKTGQSGIQMVIMITVCVRFSNGKISHLVSNHLKTGQVCPVFRCHLNTGPFDFRTQINHMNTGLVWYSDGDCNSSIAIIDHHLEILSTAKIISNN
jgi:hypothetical protein